MSCVDALIIGVCFVYACVVASVLWELFEREPVHALVLISALA